jgi:hypothetical protein
MYYNNLVAALVDDNKAPFREHNPEKLGCSPAARSNHETIGRRCTVFMPFETEFTLLLKNQNSCRILAEITIDGAKISGNGIICDSNSSVYVERSVDVAYKFKFVPVNHEDVSDPSNPENGNVVITIWKELQNGWVYTNNYNRNISTWPGVNEYARWSPYYLYGPALTYSSSTQEMKSINNVSLQGSTGAIIDGDESSQQFSSTYWNGNDGSPTKFIFNLRGTTPNSIEEKELAELHRLMKKYNV